MGLKDRHDMLPVTNVKLPMNSDNNFRYEKFISTNASSLTILPGTLLTGRGKILKAHSL